tara:strand:- start:130 stop:246 length:117 start_codon:yes stop_codon:yes gene_type:complete
VRVLGLLAAIDTAGLKVKIITLVAHLDGFPAPTYGFFQ